MSELRVFIVQNSQRQMELPRSEAVVESMKHSQAELCDSRFRGVPQARSLLAEVCL